MFDWVLNSPLKYVVILILLLPKIVLKVNGAENPPNTLTITTTTPLNQWNEAYWSKPRQDRPGWWNSFFQDMINLELYDPSDPAQVDCLRYCFMNILRNELRTVAVDRNQYIIYRSISSGPRERPEAIFFLPHLYDLDRLLENIYTHMLLIHLEVFPMNSRNLQSLLYEVQPWRSDKWYSFWFGSIFVFKRKTYWFFLRLKLNCFYYLVLVNGLIFRQVAIELSCKIGVLM